MSKYTFEDDVNEAKVLEQMKDAMAQAKTGSTQLMFFLKAGEKAVIRPLGSVEEIVLLLCHERYKDNVFDRAVCAKSFELECAWCAEQKTSGDKKLFATPHFFLQIYMHSLWKPVDNAWEQATGEGREPLAGIRLLEMKGAGPSATLLATFQESILDDKRALGKDYSIARFGTGAATKYTLLAQSKVRPVPSGVATWTRVQVRDAVLDVYPMKTVEDALAQIPQDTDEFP